VHILLLSLTLADLLLLLLLPFRIIEVIYDFLWPLVMSSHRLWLLQ
jgi:free fatty acid receptor 2